MNWSALREAFDRPLPMPRAISLRGGESDLRLVTLCGRAAHGYGFQGQGRRLGHSHEPDIEVRIGTVFFGNALGMDPATSQRDEPLFTRNRFGPDIIEREMEYPALGLRASESMLRTTGADYVWRCDWHRDAYRNGPKNPDILGPVPLRIQFVVDGPQRLRLTIDPRQGGTAIRIEDPNGTDVPLHLFIAATAGPTAVMDLHESDLRRLKWRVGSTSPHADELFDPAPRRLAVGEPIEVDSLVVSLPVMFPLVGTAALLVGASFRSAGDAAALCAPGRAEQERARVEEDWNAYFQHFSPPRVNLESARTLEQQLAGSASRAPRGTYLDPAGKPQPQSARPPVDDQGPLSDDDVSFTFYKGLWHTRTTERIDPRWGPTLTETFTCYYTGTFAWSAPVVGYYAQTHFDPRFRNMMRSVMECYRFAQAPDGLFPCYVPFGWDPKPGQTAVGFTMIPQYAWTIWQEFRRNEDRQWLASWYEPLQRYVALMDQRDQQGLKLGLWCQRHYYEGLDMFPTVDGLIIRKEPLLYSSLYAAEQVRYLDVLARIARAIGAPRPEQWDARRQDAQRAMEKHLWDERVQWYGDILADGQRETVVGMCGLFAAAYGLLPEGHDRARVRDNLESLITPYGVATVAPRDRRSTERFFWRGPVWPASCLFGAGAAMRYAPDLLPRIAAATIRLARAHPNAFECVEPHSGAIARYDEGNMVMPGLSSVVGAYALAAVMRIAAGEDLFAL